MVWNLIFIAGFLYLAVALRGQIRFLKQMETRADDRITSLETQIGDLRDRVRRIEDAVAVDKDLWREIDPDGRTRPEDLVT